MADGIREAALAWDRVLSNDPGTGVMRHVETGSDETIGCAKERGVDIPMI